MITWSADLETGVATVDADHRQLIAGLNQLEQAIQDGRGSKEIGRIVDGLERYAAAHFAREEDCMQRAQCPVAAANKAAHRRFVHTIQQARERLTRPGTGALVANQVQVELVEWLRTHIMKIDAHLRACAARVA